MLIDFHTHFFPDKLFQAIWKWFEDQGWPIVYKKKADDLVAILKGEGVNRCVSLHYPHKPGLSRSLNAFAHSLAQKYPDFIIPFGSLHPDDENPEKILKECFETYGFGGIKIHCHVQHVAPDDPRMEPIYEICQAYKKIVLIHCGNGPNFKERPTTGYGYDVAEVSGAAPFERALKKHPRLIFVVPHMGFDEIEAFVGLLSDYPNLYLDTSMTLGNYFSTRADVHPEWFHDHSDRILFGTDFPHLPYEWGRELSTLLSLGLGKEKENQILHQNAEKLLGLKKGSNLV